MRDLDTTGLRVRNGILQLLDQTKLPHVEEWISIESTDAMVAAIVALKVRGAPLIGVSAGLYFGLYLQREAPSLADARSTYEALRASRPTAVNLMTELDLLWRCYESERDSAQVLALAYERFDADVAMCAAMAEHAGALIKEGDRILTHCNTGGLATAGCGTALGAIITAHERGAGIHCYVDETRPLVQGGRLTTWELARAGVPHTLLCDNMAASLMQAGLVDKVFVGADRISTDGSAANKIGTYGLAILCRYHDVPFYVVAPSSTFDKATSNGGEIPIEQRHGDEVRHTWSLAENCYNPAFDVTPPELITALINEEGVVRPAAT